MRVCHKTAKFLCMSVSGCGAVCIWKRHTHIMLSYECGVYRCVRVCVCYKRALLLLICMSVSGCEPRHNVCVSLTDIYICKIYL